MLFVNVKILLGSIVIELRLKSPLVAKKFLVSILIAFSLFSIFATPVSFANPEGGSVSSGNATISTPDANTTIINQTSDRAVINWQTFNIAPNQTTHFQQPSNRSITVNRVNPNNGASTIGGRLTANGQIWILNPAGVLITPTARIDAAGFLATTAGISDSDFMSGNFNFVQSPDWNGAVINQGIISVADYGMAALVAPAVSNSGVIQANLGVVALASGNTFTVDFYGDQLINFGLDSQVNKPAVDSNGNQMEDAVSNSGKIIANGGKVLMTATSAAGVVRNVVNMSGVVVAKTASVRNGVIILGGSGGTVRVSGKLIASGKRAGETGGTIKVTGKTVMITDSARLDARGYSGGGQILMGGNVHGAGPEMNADYAYFGKNAVADASAIVNGNGGKVVLWSDYGTGYYGNIYARGGTQGGNGGFVETSGKAYLDSTGNVFANAPNGLAGEWLLDPYNVTITNATANGTFSGGDPNTFTPNANTATVDVATINASLNAGTSVTVNTGTGGAQAGTLTLSSAILKNTGVTTPTLTFDAAGSIVLNNNITATSGGLNIVFTAPAITIASTGASTITTNGGNFTGTAQDGFTIGTGAIVGAINAGSGTVSIAANADGAGTQSFAMTAASSITTINTSANAVKINVNAAAGGTGTAAVGNISTGSGGTVTVATNTGGNTTGGSITFVGTNPINVGTGTVSLLTSTVAARAIGLIATNVLISAGTLNATTGSSGIFVNNSGTGGLVLDTINATAGAFTLTSLNSTGITQVNPLAVGTAATFVAGSSQDITLNSGTNSVTTLAVTSGRDISYVNAGALALGASTISGAANITAGGSITQSGVLNITGEPTFTLSTATTDISLASQANNFATTPVITNNGNVRDLLLRNTNTAAAVPTLPTGLRNLTLTFNNATSLVLPGTTITGSLSVTSNGPITQTDALVVNTAAQTATFAAGAANNITLNNIGNNFRTILFTSGNNVILQTATALAIGASTISGTFDLTSAGAVTNSGTLTVAGLATFTTGANSLSINSAANNFSTVKVNSASAATIVDANSLILDASTITGALSVTTNGAITQAGALSVGGVATFAAGAANNITLDTFTNTMPSPRFTTGNNVRLLNSGAMSLGASTISGALTVTAGGSISQSAVINVTGTPTFTLNTAATDISLASQANNFVTTPVITNNGNVRDLLLRNTNAAAAVPSLPTGLRNLTLIFNNATSLILPVMTLTGSLSATVNGSITQSGALIVPVTATLVAGAANNVTLTNTSNNFGTVAVTSGNTISIVDTDALIMGATTASGALNITTNGALTQSGALIATTGLTTLNANNGDITLTTTTNDFNSVKVTSANNVNLRDANSTIYDGITANGTLTLRTAGTMTQTAALSAVGLTSLTAGTSDITLNDTANSLPSVSIVSANNASLTNSLGLNLAVSTVTGNLNITAGGTITESGILTVTGTPTFTVTAANSDISLASQANVFSTTPVFTNNGNVRDLALRNTSATAVIPTLPTGLRNLTLTFNAASINMLATALTGTLTLTTTGTITQSGAISGTTLTAKTLNNTGAVITLTNSDNDFTNIDLRARNSADSANAAGALSYTDTSGFGIAGIGTTSTVNLIGGDAITQTGAIASAAFTAKTLNNAGAAITLTTASNVVTSLNLRARNAADTANAAGAISYTQSGALSVAQIATTANASLISTGAMTQTGVIEAATLSAKTLNNTSMGITLTNASNAVTAIDLRTRNASDTSNTAGAISYVDIDGFDVATIGTASTVSLIGGDAISQSGAISSTVLTAKTLNDSGAAITLTNTANAVTTSINLRARNAADTANSAGALSFTNTGALVVAQAATTSSVNLTATGAITQTGLITGTTLTAKTLNNAGSAITLNNAGNAVAAIDLSARNAADTINAAGALSFTNTGALNINQIGTASTANLIATAAISQTGDIAASTLTAKTLNNAGAAITLTNVNNAVASIDFRARNAADSANVAGALSYVDMDGFNIALLGTTSTANLIGGGAITQTGAITSGAFTAKTLNDDGAAITLTNTANVVSGINLSARNATDSANAMGNISFTEAGVLSVAQIATTGTANLIATGAITQTGVIVASTLSAKTLLNAGAAITLNNAANAVSAIDLRARNGADTANATGTISYTDIDGFDVAGIATSSTVNLIGSDDITQSGAITGTTLTAKTLNNSGADIVLTNIANSLTSIDLRARNATDTANAAGAISFSEAGTLTVAQIATTNTVNLLATGAITQTGAITASTLTAKTLLNAGAAITLTNVGNTVSAIDLLARNGADSTNAAGALSFTNTGALNVAQAATASSISLIASGDITQTGAIAGTSLTAKTLNNSGAAITLTNSNNAVTGIDLRARNATDTANVAGALSYTDTDGFSVTLLGTTSDINLIGGNTISQTGAITGGIFTAKTLNNSGAAIILTNAANAVNSVDLSARNTTDDANAVGAISFTEAGALSIAQIATASTANLIATGTITQTGAIAASVLTAKTLLNGGAAITLTNTDNAVSSVNLRTRNGADSANAAGTISYTDADGVDIANIATTNTVGLIAGDAITQTGAITGTALTAKTLNNSGADIVLTNTANSLTSIDLRARNATDTANAAGAISFTEAGALNIARIATTSNVNLIATGTITQTGIILGDTLTAKTLLNAGAAITLTNIGNTVNAIDLRSRNTADNANASGVISYTDSNSFDVTNVSTASTVNLISGDAITDSGAITGTTLSTTSVNGTNLDFGSAITAFTASNSTSGNIVLNVNSGATLTLNSISQASSGLVEITNNAAISVGATVNAGTLSLIAAGNVSDSVGGAINVNSLLVKTLNNSGSNILLNSGNHTAGSINLQVRNAADTANALAAIDYQASNGFDVSAANTLSTVTLIGMDNLTQSGSMSGSTLIAKTLNNAGADITFNNNSNQFDSINLQSRNVADNADTAGNITFNNASDISITSLRTTANANVTSGGTIVDGGTVVVDGTLSTNSVGGMTLNNANQINRLAITNAGGGNIVFSNNAVPLTISSLSQNGGGSVAITNPNNITFGAGAIFASDGGTIALTVNSGTLIVGNSSSINTNGGALTINATDLNLNTSGALNAGSITITQNTASGSIGLGNAVGTMSISGSELSRMTANSLTLVAPANGQIQVDGVSSVQSNNINSVALNAMNSTLSNILFANNASSFKSLSANANDGIVVGANVTTTSGAMSLNADADGLAATNDQLQLNANLNAAGALTLNAQNGGILLGSSTALTGSSITINPNVNGAQNLTLSATGNIIFNGDVGNITPLQSMVISNANNIVNNGTMLMDVFTQNAGSGTTSFGSGGLTTTGASTFISNNVTGNIDVNSLSMGTNLANLTGLIAGGAGESAIETVTFLNTITPNTHFFNGIDMYMGPIPPPTPPSPQPINITSIDADLSQIALPNDIAVIYNYFGSSNTFLLDETYCSKTPNSGYCGKVKSSHCVRVSDYIVICTG